MRVLLVILLLFQIVVISSCGCAGYGEEPRAQIPKYSSVLVIADSTDTIRSIKYDIKPEVITPNKTSSPILLSYLTPTWINVNTDKSTFRFRINVPVQFYYYENKNCGYFKASMDVSQPIIDSIVAGKANVLRSRYQENYQYLLVVDSIYLSK